MNIGPPSFFFRYGILLDVKYETIELPEIDIIMLERRRRKKQRPNKPMDSNRIYCPTKSNLTKKKDKFDFQLQQIHSNRTTYTKRGQSIFVCVLAKQEKKRR